MTSRIRSAICRVPVLAALAFCAWAWAPSALADDDASDMDRPGEVENPFVLAPGHAQVLAYGVVANAGGRESQDFGEGGSASLLQAGVRFGIAPDVEGQVFTDTFLSAWCPGGDDDDPLVRRAGLGDVTLRAKFTLFRSDDGDSGLGLAPSVRLPISRGLVGSSGAEPGLTAPFEADLGHGLDLEGSSSVNSEHSDGRRVTGWEGESGLEWQFIPRWSLYLEGELDAGDGGPAWSAEGGLTHSFGSRLCLDLGGNSGLGRNAKARFVYAGLSWNL